MFCPNCGIQVNKESTRVKDTYFIQAARLVISQNKASVGMLQREFKIGFNEATRLMEQLYEAGIVGAENGTKPRMVLMSAQEFETYYNHYRYELPNTDIPCDNDCKCKTKTINKKRTWIISGILVCVLGIVGTLMSKNYGTTEVSRDSMPDNAEVIDEQTDNNNNIDRAFNEETYEYTGYVEKDEYVYEADLEQYKPFSGLYIYQETIKGSENSISYTSAETVEYIEQQGVYFTRKTDLAEDVVDSGFYYVQLLNRGTEGLIKYYTTTQESDVIVLPTGSSCQIKQTENEYESLEAGIKTYTVTTTAGVFEDCLCMIRTRTQRYTDNQYNWSNGTFYTYSYYAPNVGLVLEISRDEGVEFSGTYISKELTAY